MFPRFVLLLFFACTSLQVVTISAQTEIETHLSRYRQHFLPEKIFVHTDKSIYAGGETIWAAVYQVDGQTHRSDSLSRIVYLELQNADGKLALPRKKLYPGDGHTAGHLDLPAAILPGNYQLTAYTNYQRNVDNDFLFRKTIRIVKGLKESGGAETSLVSITSKVKSALGEPAFNLQFFPEGGDCINGVSCRVAIAATAPDGSPYQVSGYLVDQNGESIAVFQTMDNGIGSISYLPVEGQEIAVVAGKSQRRYNLPAALPEGYHLKVSRRKDTVQVHLRSNLPEGLSGAKLMLHLRGVPLLSRSIEQRTERLLFTLPVDQLPAGVLTATLFNPWNEPMAERLFYVGPEESTLQMQTDTSHYLTRAPVELYIKMPYADAAVDSLAQGRISLSVIPSDAAGGPSNDDIRSWLLLNSDLERPIPNAPELLFATSARERERKIEDYLLTREWRRFRWETISDDSEFIPEHKLEQGIYYRGQMTKYENPDAPRPGKVFLSRLSNAYAEEAVTDLDGNFTFGPYLVFDTIDVAIQGRFKAGKRNRVSDKITLDDNEYVELKSIQLPAPELPPIEADLRDPLPLDAITAYEDLSQRSLTVARNYDSLIIDLDVVDVVRKRIDPIEESRRARTVVYGNAPDNRIIPDSVGWATAASSVLSLLRTVAGVDVRGSLFQEVVRIRGYTSINLSSEPAYFIDGFPVDISLIRNFPVQQVEFIDVVKGMRASILGPRGANGAILVYTKQGIEAQIPDKPGLLNTAIIGYHKARQFASFNASLPENRNRLDLRTTLHWNPDLRTNVLGLTEDNILTSDQTGKFIIVAQGLRNDGRPFFGTAEFVVEE